MATALLYVDVDGVLNPTNGERRKGFIFHRLAPDGFTYSVALNPAHGEWLLSLAADTGAELVWATSWMHHASDLIGPLICLPTLPWVNIAPRPRFGPEAVTDIGAWKARHVVEHAQRRPFVWFEDEPDADQQVAQLARTTRSDLTW